MLSIAHVKTAFMAFHNLCEFERFIRPLYADHRELSLEFDKCRKPVEFFSYLRNIFTGHLTDNLIQKAIEWKPELPLTLERDHSADVLLIYNFWLLETAINTYVDETGRHKIFETDTDLQYPPDFERFKKTLFDTIKHSTKFLSNVKAVFKPTISPPATDSEKMKLFRRAGLTDFEYLARRRR